MLINAKEETSRSLWQRVIWVILAILLILILWTAKNLIWSSRTSVRLNAEPSLLKFIPKSIHGHRIEINSGKRSDHVALSGNYSIKVGPSGAYGFKVTFSDVLAGDSFDIQVARYRTTGFGFLMADGDLDFYIKEGISNQRVERGWELLKLSFKVPQYLHNTDLSFYVWNPNKDPAYFDNMRVDHYPSTRMPSKIAEKEFSIPKFNLMIDRADLVKLEKIRDRAMSRGVLLPEDKVWVNAKIDDGQKHIPVRVRFKGDWLDHLTGVRWSFRIKAKSNHAWNSLVQFSIQKPAVRHYLDEWVLHKLMEVNNLLATEYGFVDVSLNGKRLGLYAYEEHFDKHLPESNARREGPILKFSEEGFWQTKEIGVHVDRHTPVYESSDITAFNTKNIIKDSVLNAQFTIARSLMQAYKHGNRRLEDVFDIDLTARFYAIMDITKAYHALRWHNQRLYYNPVTSLLEPIAFDGYSETGVMHWIDRPIIGYARNDHNQRKNNEWVLQDQLFANKIFVEKYIRYLNDFSRLKGIYDLLKKFSDELAYLIDLVQQEESDYSYNQNFLIDNINQIADIIYPIEKIALKAHVQSSGNDKKQLKIFNYHCLPVDVIGSGKSKTKMKEQLNNPFALQAFDNAFIADYSDLTVDRSAKHIFFSIPGIDSVFTAKIINWPVPDMVVPRAELFGSIRLKNNALYRIQDKDIVFNIGHHTISRSLVFPEGYRVIIQPGTALNLINGAMFLSASPVLMEGNREEPIRVYSSDSSARGFTVLQAQETSLMKYVIFDHLKTLDHKGWQLTGAVTFYESKIDIDHCSFNQQHAEDALNIIRCNFTIDHSFFGGNPSDGIDVDFSTGIIRNSFFTYNANDGIDFSASTVTIDNCIVEWSGEKGISIGEESTIEIIFAKIKNCPLALASKDRSKTSIMDIELYNCKQGFAAYQKKPEFGPARIEIKAYSADKVDKLFSIEKGSHLILKEKMIEGEL